MQLKAYSAPASAQPLNVDVTTERYLPLSFDRRHRRATWLDLQQVLLKEPFFNHEISRLSKARTWSSSLNTSWSDVVRIADLLEPAPPDSVIFHVSRCGSTLLTNLYRIVTDGIALSEAAPVHQLHQQIMAESHRARLSDEQQSSSIVLAALVTLYRRLYGRPLVIKTHTIGILGIRQLRAVWPNTPFVINIRHPLEVAVSNLDKPADWVKSYLHPSTSPNIFGCDHAMRMSMSVEEYCARGLGFFYHKVLEQLDDRCHVIDYSSITSSNIPSVLNSMGLPRHNPLDHAAIAGIFDSYSKDRSRTRRFSNDTHAKNGRASSTLRHHLEKWSHAAYAALLSARPDSLSGSGASAGVR